MNSTARQIDPASMETSGQILDYKLYDNGEAGLLLHRGPNTMRNSRCTGVLAGVEAPAHIKIGSRAFYRGATLKAWLAQFQEQVCASKVA